MIPVWQERLAGRDHKLLSIGPHTVQYPKYLAPAVSQKGDDSGVIIASWHGSVKYARTDCGNINLISKEKRSILWLLKI